jgi:carbon-monoxide dehydrogenase small subunit
MNHEITLTVNGEVYRLTVASHWTLLRVIRERLALTGTKNGCEAGECGACTVLMNHQPVNSCMVLAPEADGAEIITVEGLAEDRRLDPIQEAFIETGAIQCGFCTPGALVTARALLDRNPNPTQAEIREALVGNLCRCTGYLRMVKAIQAAALRAGEANRFEKAAR